MHFVDSILVRISTGRSGGTWGPYSSTFDTSPKWVASKNNGPATGDSDYFNWWLPYSCGIWIVVWWKLKYLFLTSTTRGGCFSHPVDPSQTFTVQSIWMSCRASYLLLPPSAPKPEVLIPGDVRRHRSNLSSGQKNQQLIKKGTKRKEIHIYVYIYICVCRLSAQKCDKTV